MTASITNRSVIFVDGNNFYHGNEKARVTGQRDLSFKKIADKLTDSRWSALHYYVGRVENVGNTKLYADQRAFVDRQQRLDARIKFHFGRLERREVDQSALVKNLHAYIDDKKIALNWRAIHELQRIIKNSSEEWTMVEKAVDVFLAVDLIVLADTYDAAYILSADGDYTPAVKHVLGMGKTVHAVCAQDGHQLRQAVGKDNFLKVDRDWFDDCYVD